MKSIIEQFESDVIKNIFLEDKKLTNALLKQYKSAKVTSREFTGYGFYTTYDISVKGLRLKEHSSLELGIYKQKLMG